MVNKNKVMENLAAFVDEDMIPQMPKLEGIAFAAMAPFVIKAKVPGLMRWVEGTELVDGDNIDVEALYRQFKAKAGGKWPVQLMGFTFREEDLDKLYRYLMR